MHGWLAPALLWLGLGAAAAPVAHPPPAAAPTSPAQRPAPLEPGPIGSMQPDELMADALVADPEGDGAAAQRAPFISEFTRHVACLDDDIWWNDGSGASLGGIHRARWRQFFRDHFRYFDEAGEPGAEGTQPWLSPGVLYATLGELYVTDARQRLLVHVAGTPFAWPQVRFALRDARGAHLADAHVDTRRSSVVFAPPGRPMVRWASLLREQATDDGFDRWRMIVSGPCPIPAAAWPVLGAFFVRLQDRSALGRLGQAVTEACRR
jgi:hypothetical protein